VCWVTSMAVTFLYVLALFRPGLAPQVSAAPAPLGDFQLLAPVHVQRPAIVVCRSALLLSRSAVARAALNTALVQAGLPAYLAPPRWLPCAALSSSRRVPSC